MNPFFLVGIVVFVFVVALLTGFLIGWEVAHRKMLKQMQAIRTDAVLATAKRVAEKVSVRPEPRASIAGIPDQFKCPKCNKVIYKGLMTAEIWKRMLREDEWCSCE